MTNNSLVVINDDIELTNSININDFRNDIPKMNTNLICLHLNTRSIITNFSALEQYMITSKKWIDVIILTEINVAGNISCLYNLKGYQMTIELWEDI